MKASTYSDVRTIRNTGIKSVRTDPYKLNQFHDELMTEVIQLATQRTIDQYGAPPSPFTFFVMGSAGRFEQSIWSDQDHGIIFAESSQTAQNYFLRLGEEIAMGLFLAGYPYCDGGVMAKNPLWCKSFSNWKKQLIDWINESTWDSIRHLLIFTDARPLFGHMQNVADLKQFVFQAIHQQHRLHRIWENTIYLKKGLNALGQFLVEEHGSHAGMLNLKERVLIPYINAGRLLSLINKSEESSTLSRLKGLGEDGFISDFSRLLEIRLLYGDHSSYNSGHYLPVESLPKIDQNRLKEIIKHGANLQKKVRKLLEKGDRYGNE
ncbi:DUF294 nucleotidyltransferase-like domain-containing protein [Neobacillus sp. SM06]|uniref:DUF294 nucleotidyltransferase-like domain-containing protein n=1 Tax=Neobacillus sp. SM06 TaxID=3422492 RepID=UPI003D284E95